jgi:hypothetical protein
MPSSTVFAPQMDAAQCATSRGACLGPIEQACGAALRSVELSEVDPQALHEMIIGSHVSIAGGLDKGVARAIEVGCDCIQIFTKNNNQWAANPLAENAVSAWKSALVESGLTHPIATLILPWRSLFWHNRRASIILCSYRLASTAAE